MFNYWMLISAILFIFIDSVYLQLVRPYFEKQIQNVQGSAVQVNFLGVALCYIFLIISWNQSDQFPKDVEVIIIYNFLKPN